MPKWAVSVMGVIFLNLVLTISKHMGMYLSKSMMRFDFSAGTCLVSIQLVTYLEEFALILFRYSIVVFSTKIAAYTEKIW